ncbi:MAG: oligosaccharide flippase family protein [Clostridia bacterium]|nr:oligosaccharide flippase family protein [Clostridia bacterium]
MKEIKKQSFMEGAAVLVIAHLVVKVIGACFKIPLANILHETGMAFFSRAYNLYAAMFVMATAGLPVAVSKMVSESLAKKNYLESKKILRAAVILLTVIGAIGTCVLFFGARAFAEGAFQSPGTYMSILAISPAILFISILSAFRGYFQGHSNMIPTAYSEVLESVTKLVIGLLGAYFFMQYSYELAAAGAVFGVTLGGLFALLLLIFFYLRNKKRTPSYDTEETRTTGKIFVTLLTIAVPITIGAAVMSLTNVIDTFMIGNRLQAITVSPEMYNTLTEFFGLSAKAVSVGNPLTAKAADVMYGSYSGYAMSLFNLPPSIITSISMSIVPAISAALAIKNQSEAKLLTESSIRITTIFALPCAIGLSVLSTPILVALYNNARAQDTLALLSLAIVFVCTVSVSTAILQASGHVFIPVRNMLIGGAFKVVSNFILIAIPSLNIGGAPISTFCCYLLIASLNLISVGRIIKPKFSFRDFILKPLVSALAMGVLVYLSYNLFALLLGCPTVSIGVDFLPQTAIVTPVATVVRFKTILSLGLSIGIGVIAYAIAIFATKALKKEDIEMLPKGKKIASFMERKKLL